MLREPLQVRLIIREGKLRSFPSRRIYESKVEFVIKFTEEGKISHDLSKSLPSGLFGVADFESKVKSAKFNMEDPIWRTKIQSFWISPKVCTQRFPGSLISNERTKVPNSKWRIYSGGRKFKFHAAR